MLENFFSESTPPFLFAIPFIAGFIGWFTNWLAVKALLYPVEFVGLPPLLGWQGVMPKNAEEMSLSFSKMIREQLIDVPSLFSEMKTRDPEKLDKLVEEMTAKVIKEFSTNIAPESWQRSRDKLREYITNLVRENVCEVVDAIMERMADEAEEIIDIDEVMRSTMVAERDLMGRVLNEIADKEFKFIEMSGLYFGFFFGLVQMLVWAVYPEYWVLPAAGFFVGYATNWMAMNLIFEPKEPKRIGPFTIQGVFIKRQYEVAEKFANVLCDNVFHARNMIKHLSEQNKYDQKKQNKLTGLIEEQLDNSIAVYEKDAMVAMLASKEKLAEAREEMQVKMRHFDFEKDVDEESPVYAFIDQGDGIRRQIIQSVRKMDSAEFSNVLRPVFQKDEWKLLVAGGVIGTTIGALQYVYLFGGTYW